jgi:hypothetical protein
MERMKPGKWKVQCVPQCLLDTSFPTSTLELGSNMGSIRPDLSSSGRICQLYFS